jgi:hypothetical protein
MASAARAERRRAARAEAKQSARGDGLIFQRGDRDCMRAAVATYLRLPYSAMPAIDRQHDPLTFWTRWMDWAATRGLVMSVSAWAPGHLERWIAVVGRDGPMMHCVVMAGTELYHDPALPENRVQRIERDDVMGAVVIGEPGLGERVSDGLRRGVAAGDPRIWRIERLWDCPWAVQTYRDRGEHDRAAAMQRRLDKE